MSRYTVGLALMLGGLSLSPRALACACGCGVFDVGTTAMFPTAAGGISYIGYDFMDQQQNWSGSGKAPAAANNDKRIVTSFVTPGVQYMFSRAWGVNVEVPVWDRSFATDVTGMGDVQNFHHAALGDIRIKGIYTGWSADMSAGFSLGVKLPSGDSSYAHFDPDTEIGSGSTDVLPGFFKRGWIVSGLAWFANGQADLPVIGKRSYRPGAELDLAAGVNGSGWGLGKLGLITPELQLIGAWRGADSGSLGHGSDSGYRRLMLAPGIEYDAGAAMVNFNVAVPLAQNTTGYQLVASPLVKLTLGYMF